jgi:tetratricopeptide (TPR) repeat protein
MQALQGNLAAAAKDFSAAIDVDPSVADAWKRRGQTRAALGFDNEAIKDLTKAIALQPDHESYHQRGIVYHKMHDYRKALADFRKALDLNATNHVTWNFVGLCENSLGRTREAVIAYERAIKIEPRFKEALANLAQAYRDFGDRVNSEKQFAKAMEVDKSYVHAFHLRGLMFYGCGEIRLALADFTRGFEVDPNERNCHLMKAVCLHSLGMLSAAVAAYSSLLKADPQHQCFYLRELCLYLHKTLDKDQMLVNADVELDAYFKEAYCKRHPTNHPRICNYITQKPISSKIPDVVLSDATTNEAIKKLVDMSRRFGSLIQLKSPGFLENIRQHRMCGLAILQMAQQARAFWRQRPRKEIEKKKDKGSRSPGEEAGELLYFDPKGSSKDNGKAHEYSWRDFMDIAVKWRQISEPNDPVFWIDLLAPEAFAEGFGLQTPMVTGQMNVIRYYPYFERALAVVKKLIEDSGACNVHDQRFMLPRNKLDQLKEAKSCQDVWDVMQQGFYVETPCHSIARPGKIMAGTRITLLQKPPDGFDFTIRTPGIPSR